MIEQQEHSPSMTPDNICNTPIQQADDIQTWQALASLTSRTLAQVDIALRKSCHISLSDFDVLATLSRHEHATATMACLTATVVVTISGLSRSVTRLEQAGLVEKSQCHTDKRSVNITLTHKGRAVLKQALAVHNPIIQRYFIDTFTREQLHELARIMNEVSKK